VLVHVNLDEYEKEKEWRDLLLMLGSLLAVLNVVPGRAAAVAAKMRDKMKHFIVVSSTIQLGCFTDSIGIGLR
jgi:hypothetical protein